MSTRKGFLLVLIVVVSASLNGARADFKFIQGTQQDAELQGGSPSGFSRDSSLSNHSNSTPLAGTGGSSFFQHAGPGGNNQYQIDGKDSGSIQFFPGFTQVSTGASIVLSSGVSVSNITPNYSNDSIDSAGYTFTFSVPDAELYSLTATANTSGTDSGNSSSQFVADSLFHIKSINDQSFYYQLQSTEMSGDTSNGGLQQISTSILLGPGTYEFYGQVETQAYAMNAASTASSNLAVNLSIVPEPNSLTLSIMGAFFIYLVRQKRSGR